MFINNEHIKIMNMKTFEQHKRLSELLILLESTVFEEQRWQNNASQSSSGCDAFVKRRNDIKFKNI